MEVVKYPDKRLTEVARGVAYPHPGLAPAPEPHEQDELDKVVALAAKAKSLMIRENGIGLAANQIGDLRRWFVWQFGDIVINPQWNPVAGEKAKSSLEGCLSWEDPRRMFKRRRYRKIEASWINRKGKLIEKVLKGTPAIVFQHEVDHLNGVNVWDGQKTKAAS